MNNNKRAAAPERESMTPSHKKPFTARQGYTEASPGLSVHNLKRYRTNKRKRYDHYEKKHFINTLRETSEFNREGFVS